jgi:hypothetical protein
VVGLVKGLVGLNVPIVADPAGAVGAVLGAVLFWVLLGALAGMLVRLLAISPLAFCFAALVAAGALAHAYAQQRHLTVRWISLVLLGGGASVVGAALFYPDGFGTLSGAGPIGRLLGRAFYLVLGAFFVSLGYLFLG